MPISDSAFSFTIRGATVEDAPAIVEAVNAANIAESGESDFSVAELLDGWRDKGFDPAADAFVAVAPDGTIVGYEEIEHRTESDVANMDGYVHPEYAGRGVGTALVRAAEARARAMGSAVRQIHVTVAVQNQPAHGIFEHEGYGLARQFRRMLIDMDGPPQPPEWPEGIVVRTYVPGQDDHDIYTAVEEAFADHWGHVTTPLESWLERSIPTEGFDPSLWFLAYDGDVPAGAATCRVRGDYGWVRGLAVRRPWRGRGLGMALLRHAFAAFYGHGFTRVGLGVDAQSLTGATRLYERAGMYTAEQYDTFGKML